MKAVLRSLNDRSDIRRMFYQRLSSLGTKRWAVTVAPRGFDENASDVAVAGLGDATLATLTTAGIFARDQADEGHQLPRAIEALEIEQLGDEYHRAQERQPPKGSQASHGCPEGFSLGVCADFVFKHRSLLFKMLDLKDIVLEGGQFGGGIELLTTNPSPVFLRPVSSL